LQSLTVSRRLRKL